MNKNNSVKLKDIAIKAGLSINAVSKALRDSNDISPSTKQKVKEIAESLGYIPDSSATSLRKGKTNLIAIVINNFFNPYYQIICEKLYHFAKDLGYQSHMIYCDTYLMDMKDLQSILVNKFCGIITFVEPSTEVAKYFKKLELPLILIGIKTNTPYVDCIYTDDIMGGSLVGNYFVEGKYQNALYTSDSISETSYRRFFGFTEVINRSSKTCDFISYTPQEDIVQLTYNKIKEQKIDFVFCFSDSLAIRLTSFLEKKKMKKSLMIFGFDNLSEYYPLIIKVNSVGSKMEEIAKYACEHIVERINCPTETKEYINKVFPTYLSLK